MQTNDKFILKELGDICDTMMIHKSVLSGSKKKEWPENGWKSYMFKDKHWKTFREPMKRMRKTRKIIVKCGFLQAKSK